MPCGGTVTSVFCECLSSYQVTINYFCDYVDLVLGSQISECKVMNVCSSGTALRMMVKNYVIVRPLLVRDLKQKCT